MAKILGFGLVQLMPSAPAPIYRQIMPLSPSMTVPATPIVSVPSTDPTPVAPAVAPAPSSSPPGDAPSSDAVTAPQPAPGVSSTLVDASKLKTMQEDMDVPGSGLKYADEEETAPTGTAPGDNKMVMGIALVAGLGLAGMLAYSMMKKPARATPNRRRRNRRAA